MTKKEAWLGLGSIAVILVCVYMLSLKNVEDSGAVAPSEIPTTVPPMTELSKRVFEASTGFEHLVSYEDGGFSPSTLTIKKGQTVRFTNNSSKRLLWISAGAVGGASIYPGGSDSCGQSSFDSCVTMEPHDFWEFTFDEEGEWGYRNAADASHTGIVVVTSNDE